MLLITHVTLCRSGSGKTTFLNVLCGKAAGQVGGEVLINGERLPLVGGAGSPLSSRRHEKLRPTGYLWRVEVQRVEAWGCG